MLALDEVSAAGFLGVIALDTWNTARRGSGLHPSSVFSELSAFRWTDSCGGEGAGSLEATALIDARGNQLTNGETMTKKNLEAKIDIDATPDQIWNAVSDFRRMPRNGVPSASDCTCWARCAKGPTPSTSTGVAASSGHRPRESNASNPTGPSPSGP